MKGPYPHCPHDGRMLYLTTGPDGKDVWYCVTCGRTQPYVKP